MNLHKIPMPSPPTGPYWVLGNALCRYNCVSGRLKPTLHHDCINKYAHANTNYRPDHIYCECLRCGHETNAHYMPRNLSYLCTDCTNGNCPTPR